MHVHVEGAREMIDSNIPMHPGALAAPAQEAEANEAPEEDEDQEQAAIQQAVRAPADATQDPGAPKAHARCPENPQAEP